MIPQAQETMENQQRKQILCKPQIKVLIIHQQTQNSSCVCAVAP